MTMAEIPRGCWPCSTCNLLNDMNLLVCPQCQAKRPNSDDAGSTLGDGQPVHSLISQPAGNVQDHCAEIHKKTEQQISVAVPQFPIHCHSCGTLLEVIGKFCPECGTRLSIHNITQNAPTNIGQFPIDSQHSMCYFCEQPLQLTPSGEKQCLHCRKQQPNPQGPLCIHGCGVRLINAGVKVCARCGKSQLVRTPVRPTDSLSPSVQLEYGTRRDYGYGYGYGHGYQDNPTQSVSGAGMVLGPQNIQPFGPQQFGPQASIQTVMPIRQPPPPPPPPPELPYPNSGHAQGGKDSVSGPTVKVTSPSTAGMGGNSPSSLLESVGRSGHPYGAWFIEVEGSSEDSKSSGSEDELKSPVQDTAQDIVQATESHASQPEDNKNNRKRKIKSKSDDAGKSKQIKNDSQDAGGIELQGDAEAPNSPKATDRANGADKATGVASRSTATTTTSGVGASATRTDKTTGAASRSTATTTTSGVGASATRTATNQGKQV